MPELIKFDNERLFDCETLLNLAVCVDEGFMLQPYYYTRLVTCLRESGFIHEADNRYFRYAATGHLLVPPPLLSLSSFLSSRMET